MDAVVGIDVAGVLVLFIAPFVIAQSVKSILVTPWLGAHWGKLEFISGHATATECGGWNSKV